MADYSQLMNLEKKPKQQAFPSHAEQIPSHQSTEQSTSQSVTSGNIERKQKEIMQSSKQDSLQASTLASTLAIQPGIIETIRKVVKTPAKEEVLYVRVTKEEKKQLGDIEYTYQRQDIPTSANELGRIAINFLIADFKENGENSILAKVLEALHA